MASLGEVRVDYRDIVCRIPVKVHITGYRLGTLRMRIGVWMFMR